MPQTDASVNKKGTLKPSLTFRGRYLGHENNLFMSIFCVNLRRKVPKKMLETPEE